MRKQKGFTHIEVVLIVVSVLGIGGLVAMRVLDSQVSQTSASSYNPPKYDTQLRTPNL